MKKLNIQEQQNAVDKFLIHCTPFDETKNINYSLTSEGWAKLISKWAGVEITTDAVNHVFIKDYSIKNVEVCKGIYCFAERLKLTNNKKK